MIAGDDRADRWRRSRWRRRSCSTTGAREHCCCLAIWLSRLNLRRVDVLHGLLVTMVPFLIGARPTRTWWRYVPLAIAILFQFVVPMNVLGTALVYNAKPSVIVRYTITTAHTAIATHRRILSHLPRVSTVSTGASTCVSAIDGCSSIVDTPISVVNRP